MDCIKYQHLFRRAEPCCLSSKTKCMDCELSACDDHVRVCYSCHSTVCSGCFEANHPDCYTLVTCPQCKALCTGCNRCFERLCPCDSTRRGVQCKVNNKRHIFCSSLSVRHTIASFAQLSLLKKCQPVRVQSVGNQSVANYRSPRRPVPREDCCSSRAC